MQGVGLAIYHLGRARINPGGRSPFAPLRHNRWRTKHSDALTGKLRPPRAFFILRRATAHRLKGGRKGMSRVAGIGYRLAARLANGLEAGVEMLY